MENIQSFASLVLELLIYVNGTILLLFIADVIINILIKD